MSTTLSMLHSANWYWGENSPPAPNPSVFSSSSMSARASRNPGVAIPMNPTTVNA